MALDFVLDKTSSSFSVGLIKQFSAVPLDGPRNNS
jgi:hypothetical protein